MGFYGKLPSRGDFVRFGLPRSFVDPWDAWFQRGIAFLDERRPDWVAAWLEAPVWRFRLPPGCCGAEAAIGLWMPSVDRVGRYFPLTVAAVGVASALAGGFLDTAEQAATEAVERDVEPDALATRIARAYEVGGAATGPPAANAEAIWWTEGGPRVPAATVATRGLPEDGAFAATIDGDWNLAETGA